MTFLSPRLNAGNDTPDSSVHRCPPKLKTSQHTAIAGSARESD